MPTPWRAQAWWPQRAKREVPGRRRSADSGAQRRQRHISIEYKEFGIRLTLTPTVVDRNRITLKVAPEVSELDYSNAVHIHGTRCRPSPCAAPTPACPWPMAKASSSAA